MLPSILLYLGSSGDTTYASVFMKRATFKSSGELKEIVSINVNGMDSSVSYLNLPGKVILSSQRFF